MPTVPLIRSRGKGRGGGGGGGGVGGGIHVGGIPQIALMPEPMWGGGVEYVPGIAEAVAGAPLVHQSWEPLPPFPPHTFVGNGAVAEETMYTWEELADQQNV